MYQPFLSCLFSKADAFWKRFLAVPEQGDELVTGVCGLMLSVLGLVGWILLLCTLQARPSRGVVCTSHP